MKEAEIDQRLLNILQELSFQNASELVKDYMLTELLYRLSNFAAEVQHFEKKNDISYLDFEKSYEQGEEDFERHDDLMSWQFAEEGKKYWSAKVEELKSDKIKLRPT